MEKNINYGTRVLLLSHTIFWLAANLLGPFFGIFYVTELTGVSLTEVGIGALIFYLSFGITEPLVGFLADKIKGLKDEVFFVIVGFGLRGILFIAFALATNVWHLYMFQLGAGIFRALAGPADKVLYANFISEAKQKATIWALDESLTNVAAAIGAGLGGYFAEMYGFRRILVVAGALTIAAALVNLLIIKEMKKRRG